MIVAAIIAFALMFLWTLINVVLAAVLWYSHKLIQSDKRVLGYLVLYWVATAAGLVLIAMAVHESGVLQR